MTAVVVQVTVFDTAFYIFFKKYTICLNHMLDFINIANAKYKPKLMLFSLL